MEGNTAVKEIFDNISDEELLIAVLDIKQANEKGIVSESVIEYATKISDTGEYWDHDLFYAKFAILEQAAFRWADRQKA